MPIFFGKIADRPLRIDLSKVRAFESKYPNDNIEKRYSPVVLNKYELQTSVTYCRARTLGKSVRIESIENFPWKVFDLTVRFSTGRSGFADTLFLN